MKYTREGKSAGAGAARSLIQKAIIKKTNTKKTKIACPVSINDFYPISMC